MPVASQRETGGILFPLLYGSLGAGGCRNNLLVVLARGDVPVAGAETTMVFLNPIGSDFRFRVQRSQLARAL
jgi:hypothetical protein